MRMTGVGLAIGVLGSVAAGRVLTSVVEGARVDGTIIAVASVLLLLTTLLAALLPAWRALRFDPLQALRAD
jgi:ABC-type antimicrobial peptide transport system permease subunit